jgi:hypothetical protein
VILPGPLRTISTTPSRVVTVVPDEISVDPSVGAEYELAELIATHALPDHTDITPVTELKYKAPTRSVLPSLSTDGADVLDPR